MKSKGKIKAGDLAFSSTGEKVRVVAIVDGKYLARKHFSVPSVTHSGRREYEDPYAGTYSELFTEAPTVVYDEEVERLRLLISDLEESVSALKDGFTGAWMEHNSRKEQYDKYKGLDKLNLFIDGKITHAAVIPDYGYNIDVGTLDDVLDTLDVHGTGQRLVSLFGRSDGDMSWKINRETDGTGDWSTIHPCESLEEAREKAKGYVERQLDATIHNPSPFWEEAAKQWDVEIPAAYADACREVRVKYARERREGKMMEIEKIDQELKALGETV